MRKQNQEVHKKKKMQLAWIFENYYYSITGTAVLLYTIYEWFILLPIAIQKRNSTVWDHIYVSDVYVYVYVCL